MVCPQPQLYPYIHEGESYSLPNSLWHGAAVAASGFSDRVALVLQVPPTTEVGGVPLLCSAASALAAAVRSHGTRTIPAGPALTASQTAGLLLGGLGRALQREEKRWRPTTLAARYRAFGELCSDMAGWHPSLGVTIHNITPELLVGWVEAQFLPRHAGSARTRLTDGSVVCSSSLVDTCLSHLSTSFELLEPPRSGEYDPGSRTGNPIKSPTVRRYKAGYLQDLKDRGFQAQAAVVIQEGKVHKLVLALYDASDIASTKGEGVQAATLLRDGVYFLYLWDSWQRGAEGAAIQASKVRVVPGGMEVEVGDTKANRSGFSGLLSFPCNSHRPELCVVAGMHRLLRRLALVQGLPCDDPVIYEGYVFRKVAPNRRQFSRDAFTGDAAYNRLLKHLKDFGMYDGESLHSFRRGANQHARALGVPAAERQARGLWASPTTARRYDRPSGKLPLSKRPCYSTAPTALVP